MAPGSQKSEVRTAVRAGALHMSVSDGAAASEAQMVSWCTQQGKFQHLPIFQKTDFC